MALDDDFSGDDPYQVVALVFAGFECEHCYDYCAGNPPGSSGKGLIPYRVMAEVAKAAGWKVAERADKDWLILCPKCCVNIEHKQNKTNA
jgi:hypothetical protein